VANKGGPANQRAEIFSKANRRNSFGPARWPSFRGGIVLSPPLRTCTLHRANFAGPTGHVRKGWRGSTTEMSLLGLWGSVTRLRNWNLHHEPLPARPCRKIELYYSPIQSLRGGLVTRASMTRVMLVIELQLPLSLEWSCAAFPKGLCPTGFTKLWTLLQFYHFPGLNM
jgi:hypothetical protein